MSESSVLNSPQVHIFSAFCTSFCLVTIARDANSGVFFNRESKLRFMRILETLEFPHPPARMRWVWGYKQGEKVT